MTFNVCKTFTRLVCFKLKILKSFRKLSHEKFLHKTSNTQLVQLLPHSFTLGWLKAPESFSGYSNFSQSTISFIQLVTCQHLIFLKQTHSTCVIHVDPTLLMHSALFLIIRFCFCILITYHIPAARLFFLIYLLIVCVLVSSLFRICA